MAEHVNDYTFTLEEVDTDGAIREQGEAVEEQIAGDTRFDFLKKSAFVGGAAVGGGALLGALVPAGAMAANTRPPAKFGAGDIGILNYALTLEYLEAAFYNEATKNNVAVGVQTKVFLKATTEDENAHVAALKKALGKKAAKKPKFNFKGTTSSEGAFQTTALKLENTGVGAYSGQALNIKSATVVKAALSILTIEARHAAVIGLIVGGNDKGITPNGAFDKALTANQVIAAVNSLGYTKKI